MSVNAPFLDVLVLNRIVTTDYCGADLAPSNKILSTPAKENRRDVGGQPERRC